MSADYELNPKKHECFAYSRLILDWSSFISSYPERFVRAPLQNKTALTITMSAQDPYKEANKAWTTFLISAWLEENYLVLARIGLMCAIVSWHLASWGYYWPERRWCGEVVGYCAFLWYWWAGRIPPRCLIIVLFLIKIRLFGIPKICFSSFFRE